MIREVIKELTCKGVADLFDVNQHRDWSLIEDRLQRMEADGLLTMSRTQARVSAIGKVLIRNVANAFDLKYHKHSIDKENTFSQAI